MNKQVWKVISPGGQPVASCVYAEDAAAIVASYGSGAKIRYQASHKIKNTVYTDGVDGEAAESYDAVAEICQAGRIKLHNESEARRVWREALV